MNAPERVLQVLSLGTSVIGIVFCSIKLIKYEKYYGSHLVTQVIEIIFFILFFKVNFYQH